MDGLTFTCQFAENGSQPNEHKSLILQTYTRKKARYFVKVDPKLCQKPTIFLVDDICYNHIIECIDNITYIYDSTTDTIKATLPVFGSKYLEFNLHKDMSHIRSLEQRITELELLIDQLNPWEIIHEVEYPSWSSIDEFKSLPSYKYIDAALNWRRYFHTVDGELVSLGEYKYGEFPIVYQITYSDYLKIEPHMQEFHAFRLQSSPFEGKYEAEDHELYVLSQREQTEQKKRANPLYTFFAKSCSIAPYARNYKIHNTLYKWIETYINGWFLLHWNLTILHAFELDIKVANNKCYITLKRSKKQYDPIDGARIHRHLPKNKSQSIDYLYPRSIIFCNLTVNGVSNYSNTCRP